MTAMAQLGPQEYLFIVFITAFFLLGIVLPTAFWIWMLVDCLKNEPENSTEKLMWALVVLFGHFIGGALYYFLRRRPRLRTMSS